MPSLLRTDKEITEIYNRNVDAVYRLCYSYMKNQPEAEDMVQETFLKLILTGKEFQSERHERAWLIVTASNQCKDTLKKWWRRTEDIADHQIPDDRQLLHNPVLEAILALPENFKTVVYLYYYEGYTTAEIGELLHIPPETVRTRLMRARKRLKGLLGGEPDA